MSKLLGPYGKGGFVGGYQCLCCKGELVPLIDFGNQPLANTYNVTEKFPLAVNRCVECCHLQLHEFVDPKILYSDYAYCSDTGRTARDYFRDFARMAKDCYPDAKNVLDIACNDGSQLDVFKAMGLETFGVDPATNFGLTKGHKVWIKFFEDTSFVREFDVITAQNVLAHTKDPMTFLEGCKRIMHDKSRLFIQTSQANMIVNGECDAIYHEHISYFNARSMRTLIERSGLRLLDIVMKDIHGTSYVFVIGKNGLFSEHMMDRLEWEYHVGMYNPSLYHWWVSHVEQKIRRIARAIHTYVRDGFYTVGCGAAAKGISVLNMAGVKLDALYDSTTTKWGEVASGMPILPFSQIANLKHEKVLFVILPWNLENEIRRNVLALRDNPADVFINTR